MRRYLSAEQGSSAARGRFQGMPSSFARTFAVPAGSTASGNLAAGKPIHRLHSPCHRHRRRSRVAAIGPRPGAPVRWHRPGRSCSAVPWRLDPHGLLRKMRRASSSWGAPCTVVFRRLGSCGLTISTGIADFQRHTSSLHFRSKTVPTSGASFCSSSIQFIEAGTAHCILTAVHCIR